MEDHALTAVIQALGEMRSGNQDLEIERAYRENWRIIQDRAPEERIRCYQAMRDSGVDGSGLMPAIYMAVEDIALARRTYERDDILRILHDAGEHELAALYSDREAWDTAWAEAWPQKDLPC
jgi:hypothetical protein